MRTYILFSFGMIFFRTESVSKAIKIIKSIFVWNPWIILDNKSLYTAGLDLYDFRVLIVSSSTLKFTPCSSFFNNIIYC